MITPPLVQLLLDAGFTDGWAMDADVLVIWEHEEDPPAPLVRPKTDEPTEEPVADDLVEGEQP